MEPEEDPLELDPVSGYWTKFRRIATIINGLNYVTLVASRNTPWEEVALVTLRCVVELMEKNLLGKLEDNLFSSLGQWRVAYRMEFEPQVEQVIRNHSCFFQRSLTWCHNLAIYKVVAPNTLELFKKTLETKEKKRAQSLAAKAKSLAVPEEERKKREEHQHNVRALQNEKRLREKQKKEQKKLRDEIAQSGLLDEFYATLPQHTDQEADSLIYCVESSIYAHCQDENLSISSASNLGLSCFSLPSVIEWMGWLTELNLSNNKLSSLPPEICQLTSLKKLVLANNRLLLLPAEISVFTELQTLNICYNQIIHLPEEIGELVNLLILDMSQNQVTALPSVIGKLKKLQSFYFTHNRVSIIPHEFVKLKSLSRVGLWANPVVNVPPEVYFRGAQALREYVEEYVSPQTTLVLSQFLEKPHHFSDITFLVAGQQFPAHKSIVTYRSPTLATVLTQEMKQYTIEGQYKPKPFKIVLDFMYSDVIAPSMYEDAELTEQVISLADFLKIERLQSAMKIINNNNNKHKLDELFRSDSQTAKNLLERNIVAALTVEKSVPELRLFKPKDMLFSDVEFEIEGTVFKVHKILFALSSEYFMKMFTSGMKESESKIISLPMSAPAFRIVQEYCYKGTIEEDSNKEGEEEGESVELQGEHLIELLTVSDTYQLGKLKDMIQCIVSYSIDTENACFLFSIANLYRCPIVEGACIHFIRENMMKYVTTTEGWKELDEELQQKLSNKLQGDDKNTEKEDKNTPLMRVQD